MKMISDPSLIRTQAYIAGTWRDTEDGSTFDVLDPASGDIITSVADGGESEAVAAVAAAKAAFPAWAEKTAHDRARILMRWHDLMLDNDEDLASIMTAEGGKPDRDKLKPEALFSPEDGHRSINTQ